MRVPNGESPKCQFSGGNCESPPLPGQPFCAVHLAPASEPPRRREPEPPPAERARRSVSQEEALDFDFAVEGARLSQKLIAEESKARLEYFRQQQEHPGRRVKARPFQAFRRPVRKDRTAMVHPETGENLVKPGWACRWVRKTDSQGRPSDERIEEFRSWGYEPVMYTDKEGTERPLEGLFGVALQAPLEAYSARQADYTPVGAYNRWDLMEDAEEAVRDLNRKAGIRAASIAVEEEHRSQRVEIAPGQRIIDEH